MRSALSLSLAALLMTACMPRGPVIDTSAKPSGVGGTISGTVRGTAETIDLAGRKVTAVNLDTGETHETTTAAAGGYTMKVPQGRYRVEVELRGGEALAEAPDELRIDASDMDADRDFVIVTKPTKLTKLTKATRHTKP
jgi:hypothetical protein